MVPELDGAGDEGPEHVLLDVLNAEQCRTAGVGLELPKWHKIVMKSLSRTLYLYRLDRLNPSLLVVNSSRQGVPMMRAGR